MRGRKVISDTYKSETVGHAEPAIGGGGGGGGGMQILTPIAHLVFAPLNSCHLFTIPVGTSGKYQVGHIASRHQRVLFVCRSSIYHEWSRREEPR